jgi:hypothetical protein
MENQLFPDYSFDREGQPLSAWLLMLVDHDRTVRDHAGEVLHAMELGLPHAMTSLEAMAEYPDTRTQMARTESAIRETLAQPNFPTSEYVRRLCGKMISMHQDWLRRVEEGAFNRSEDWAPGLLPAELVSSSGYMTGRVFRALSRELLVASDLLVEMLETPPGLRSEAAEAMVRIGPPANALANSLLQHLDAKSGSIGGTTPCFYGAHALGVLSRNQCGFIDKLIQRLRSDAAEIRASAAETLECVGPNVCGREEEIVSQLMASVSRSGSFAAGVGAIASVGRHIQQARSFVISRALPGEPRIVTNPGPSGCPHDITMFERGEAIRAMRHFADYPDECVPVLISSLDSFEEYDPDLEYFGPASRIADALAAFGVNASAAVGSLLRYLANAENNYPRDVIRALVAIGKASAGAIHILQELHLKSADSNVPVDLNVPPIHPDDDFTGWAIQKLMQAANQAL